MAAIKAFAGYAQFESIECMAPLQDVSGIKAKKAAPKEVSFLTVEQMSALINLSDINSHTGFRHRMLLTLLYDSGCRVQELCDITIADVSMGSVSTVRLQGKGNKYRTVVISDETASLIRHYISRYRSNTVGTQPLITKDTFFNGLLRTFPLLEPNIRVSLFYR